MKKTDQLARIAEGEHAIEDARQHVARVLEDVARRRAAATATKTTTGAWAPKEKTT